MLILFRFSNNFIIFVNALNADSCAQVMYVTLKSFLQCKRSIIVYYMEVHRSCIIGLQGAAEKSGPLNFFAVFSATVWGFNMKFSCFIY